MLLPEVSSWPWKSPLQVLGEVICNSDDVCKNSLFFCQTSTGFLPYKKEKYGPPAHSCFSFMALIVKRIVFQMWLYLVLTRKTPVQLVPVLPSLNLCRELPHHCWDYNLPISDQSMWSEYAWKHNFRIKLEAGCVFRHYIVLFQI